MSHAESPSFAALSEPRNDDAAIAAKWHGSCDPGIDHPVTCNSKVIGAQWFDAAGLADANPGEYHSPRDFDGHGQLERVGVEGTGSYGAGRPAI